tara:strand:- start:24 stop:164 length:141 start_codon:yes stop_codon:yes gene_type:complete
MSAIKKFLKNSKVGKYIIAGSFFFFLIKGFIWLVVIAFTWFGLGKL